jgi:uncharacterized protein YkwD
MRAEAAVVGLPTRRLALLLALLVPLVAVAAFAAAGGPLAASYERIEPHPLEASLAELVNAEREAAGLPPLARSATLALAARHHAREMAEEDYFSHSSPRAETATVRLRVARAGGTVVTVGENLALLRASPEVAARAVRGWMESEGHRENLLRPTWTHVGHGVAERGDRLYLVQVFARDDAPLVAAFVLPSLLRSIPLAVDVASEEEGIVSLMAAGGARVDGAVDASGRVRLELAGVSADEPTHLRLAWGRPEATSLVVQASGWFDPATGRYTPDEHPARPVARIAELQPSGPPASDALVHLTFQGGVDGLVLVVGGQPAEAERFGTSLRVVVHGSAAPVEIAVGYEIEPQRLEVLHRLHAVRSAAGWTLLPHVPRHP